MALLMSDMAEGSSAVRTLQNNVYGAQYDQQNVQEAAKQQQLKTQEEAATLEKTRLSNLVTDNNFKIETNSRNKLIEVAGSKPFLTAKANGDTAEQLRLLALGQIESGNVEQGTKNLGAAELADSKRIAADARRIQNDREQVANAASVIDAVPSDRIEETYNNLPEGARKTIEAQVGKENWDKFTPEEKKKAVHNLMMNAKSKLTEEGYDNHIKTTKILAESREKVAKEHDLAKARLKAGSGGTSSKEDLKALNTYFHKHASDTALYLKESTAADKEIDAAKAALDSNKAKWFNKEDTKKAEDALNAAIAKKQKLEQEHITKDFNNAELLPKSETKTRILEQLKQQAAVIPPTEEKSKPKAKDVTNNKGLSEQDQQALDWANKNPKDPRAIKIKEKLGVK